MLVPSHGQAPSQGRVPSHSQPGPSGLLSVSEVSRGHCQHHPQLCGCVLHLQLTVPHGHLGRLDA